MAQLEPGLVFDHYRIGERLGQGGQADAFKAEDLRLHRPVVIKMLRTDLDNAAARRRFDREARLCSALDHPNVAGVHDIGERDGVPYIVMQYVEGQTLKQLVAGRPLDVPSTLSIGIQIADALAAAHARGIVHRDMKPSNVIVMPSGQVKVLDFGLAKMLADELESVRGTDEPVTELGVPYGSLGYGSPEQASGDPVDHRSDVFSVGVLIYEMATGHRPFTGRNRLEVLHAVMSQAPRPLAQLNPAVPPGLQPILDRVLAKNPRDRPPMAAVREELKALMRQLSRDPGHVPTEVSSTLVAPQHARSSWLLGTALGRVFARRRGPAMAEPRTDPIMPARTPVPGMRPARWGGEGKTAVAVLPFKNLSGDPSADFYEISLADGVINELAHLRSLVVRPLSYVVGYAGQIVDPGQVGEELAASAVLVGSFIKAPDRFRVTAQLVATQSGEILWSDKIDIPAADLITVQDTIAERVIAGLQLKLTPEEQRQLDKPATASPEAYEFYLRGRNLLLQYLLRTFDDADLDVAIRMFKEAVRLDPTFALAWAALGRCYVHHAQGYGGPDYYRQAEEALQKSLALDPSKMEARLQMVHVYLHRGDRERAHREIAVLRQEAPNQPSVVFAAAMFYRLDGLYEKALAEYDHLLEINPRDVVLVSYSRGRVYTHQGLYDRAIVELERARSLEPDHPMVKTFLAVCYFNQGRVDEAQPLVEEVLHQHPHLEGVLPVLAWCLSARGEHDKARALITDRVKEIAHADHDIAFWLSSFYSMEGLLDDALAWAQTAVRLGNENYPLFAESRKLENLRRDPRGQALLAELKQRWEARRRA
jgi:serine/threonine-protein kinase